MRHYIAIVEDAGSETAIGVWFPDLPGCFSAGDTVEEAMENAPEAIGLYAEALAKTGRDLPPARALDEIRSDPAFAEDIRDNMVALIPAPQTLTAAE